jgi:dephospho-CoA kinase
LLVVGLTGGIGSGKSTVSRMLADRGAVVIDADQVAREVVEPGQPAHQAVVERFGPDVLSEDGSLDRARLAALVFEDASARADLNAIVHPAVGAVMAERVRQEVGTDRVVVLDIPLLVEADNPERPEMAGVIVVDCPPEVAVRRLGEQRGMPEDQVRARMAAQASREERLARADWVVDNSGSLEQLDNEVDRCWAWLGRLAGAPPPPS